MESPWWKDTERRNAWLAEVKRLTAELEQRRPRLVYTGVERRSEPRGFLYYVATGATLSEVREACPTPKR